MPGKSSESYFLFLNSPIITLAPQVECHDLSAFSFLKICSTTINPASDSNVEITGENIDACLRDKLKQGGAGG
jgi:hypothetical protein